MLRKITAILFICLLTLFYYDRVMSYVSCGIINITDSSSKCDCEKQVKDMPGDTQQSSSQKTISKEKAEDLFSDNAGFLSSLISANNFSSEAIYKNLNLLKGFDKNIFQPPRF
jgi:hypothetical protein